MIDLHQKLVGMNRGNRREECICSLEVAMLIQPDFTSWAAGLRV